MKQPIYTEGKNVVFSCGQGDCLQVGLGKVEHYTKTESGILYNILTNKEKRNLTVWDNNPDFPDEVVSCYSSMKNVYNLLSQEEIV